MRSLRPRQPRAANDGQPVAATVFATTAAVFPGAQAGRMQPLAGCTDVLFGKAEAAAAP